jgi:putative membrane-bound dehydrogenase-like protein
MFRMILRTALAFVFVYSRATSAAQPLPTVPDGFEIEVAAEPPVVERPVVACFDERGRLFVVDSSGANEPFEKLLKNPPHRIVVVEDTDGDGKFDRRTLFADKLVMPQGVLPYRGAVYTASPPGVWKLEDTDGDGVCDKRTEIVTGFGSNGNAADIHGPFLGPDGWLYLCDGRHGHKVTLADGKVDQGLAGGIFRFRTDGSRFERVCGGGFDNPVEIDFTEEGEMLGTVNILHGNPRQDCLVHWVEGGVYPRADQEQCLAEFKRTGDLLPPIKEFGHVAVAGMTRYRSEGFGPEFRNNLFITFFNRHKVIRSILERSGSTFASREEEFLSSDEKDFHPTDVLEDADGSLLVIDTGGWFRIGCPVSEISKPDVLGAIYRVRKKGMKKIDDPRGFALDMERRSPEELVSLLDDPRPAICERTIELLACGDATASAQEIRRLFTARPESSSPKQRRNAMRAVNQILARIDAEDADTHARMVGIAPNVPKKFDKDAELTEKTMRIRKCGQLCLDIQDAAVRDPDETVRLACLIVGTMGGVVSLSDPNTQSVRQMVVTDSPAIRRAAAVALGKMSWGADHIPSPPPLDRSEDANAGNSLEAILKNVRKRFLHAERERQTKAISALFDSIRQGRGDRFLEHAILFALIQTNDRDETLTFLSDHNPQVRRAALIALDQMDDGKLTREEVTPLLDTDDPQLRKTALAVISSRKGWATELVGLLRGWLQEEQPSEERLSLLRGTLLAQTADPAIQQLIGEALSNEKTSPPVRLLLWEVIYRTPLPELPEPWLEAMGRTLRSGLPAEVRPVIGIVGDRKLEQFDEAVLLTARNRQVASDLRIEGLAAVAPRMRAVDDEAFRLLADHLKTETPPLLLLAAARGLAEAPLSASQLGQLSKSIPEAGPLALPILLRVYQRTSDDAVGMGLVAALNKSAAVENLAAEELAGILRKYPERVQKEAAELLKRLGGSSLEEQKAKLKELAKLLDPPGDAKRGRDVFSAKKGGCANCHTIAGEGGRVGPDLTKIGASRSGTDILEAIVFPSASFAREFRPYVIATDAGKTFTGIISRQTADAIHLRTSDLAEIRIPRAAIEDMKESNTSIMPKGLDTTLSPTELRDLLAYLQQLK